MNHKFEKNDTDSFNWDLIIILNNKIKLVYAIYYDFKLKYYYVYIPKNNFVFNNKSYTSYKRKHGLKIIQYLVSNNICTIDEAYNYNTYNILKLTQHSLLELI